MMTVLQLFAEFGEIIGIPELELDSGGECSLEFDDVLLDFQHDPDRDELLLSSDLGQVPDGSNGLPILEANFNNALTGLGSLGLNGNHLVFVQRVGISNLDGNGLELVLREVLDRIRFWKEWLMKLPTENGSSDEMDLPTETAIRI